MSISLSQAQTNLDVLMTASASGTLNVRIGERSISYRSMDELLKAIAFWRSEVSRMQRVAAGGSRHNFGVASFGSGR